MGVFKVSSGVGASFLPLTQVCLVCQQRCDGKLPVDAEKPAPTIGFEYTQAISANQPTAAIALSCGPLLKVTEFSSVRT